MTDTIDLNPPRFELWQYLAILDAEGHDTGNRGYFDGIEVDAQGDRTGRAHITGASHALRGGHFVPLERLQAAATPAKKTRGDRQDDQLKFY